MIGRTTFEFTARSASGGADATTPPVFDVTVASYVTLVKELWSCF